MQRFGFSWTIPNSNTLRIKLGVDNSVWKWNIEQSSSNRVVMFSSNDLKRAMTKGGDFF